MSPRKTSSKSKSKSKAKSKAKSKTKPTKKAASKKSASAAAKRTAPKKAARRKTPDEVIAARNDHFPRSGKRVEDAERNLELPDVRTSGSLNSSLSAARRPRKSGPGEAGEGTSELQVERTVPRGMGSDAAGQSGDIQGLSEVADDDSESVEELEEEGQSYEAEVIAGVEHADDDVEAGVPRRRRKLAADAEEEELGDADEDVETGGES
jgi:hypothetical protein